MLGKVAAVLALAVSCAVAGISPSQASSKGSYPGWYDANASAAQSRANLLENVLSPVAVKKVKYLRSITTPVVSPRARCQAEGFESPLPAGGYLYAVTNGKVSKYNPGTGKLIWRKALLLDRFGRPTHFCFESLAISGNTLIASGGFSNHHGNFPSAMAAYNATTGKQLWLNSELEGLNPRDSMAVAGSYVIAEGEDRGGAFVWVLNLSNGTFVWTGGPCTTTAPLVVGGLVIENNGTCDGFEAQSLATGNVAWNLSGSESAPWNYQIGDLSGPAGAHLYATDPTGTVEDLNPLTGQEEYSLSGAVTVLAVDLSRVYATCGSSQLCAYNIGDGALEWQDNYSPGLIAVADGVLYLDSGVALNAATGQVIKTLWPGGYGTPLAVGNGRIAVVTDPRVLDLYGLNGS
jgi:hypothetical protein